MKKIDVASLIDHTTLKANVRKAAIKKLCDEAKEYKFRAVCVNQTWVEYCAELLGADSDILIACVIDFPLGAGNFRQKLALAEVAKDSGATELDVVMNAGKFLDGDYKEVEDELKVVAAVLPTKVIIETGHLTDEQILKAAEIVSRSGADYIKTSTGWDPKVDIKEKARQVKLIRDNFPELKIKAAGGIKTLADLELMLNSGANIVGASDGAKIVQESKRQ
jgi:deoxyribose-phosphate aldolase